MNNHKINLADIFSKVENYWKYSIEEFKVWLKNIVPENGWKDIKKLYNIDDFSTLHIKNPEIIKFLFDLGLSPKFVFINAIETIEDFKYDFEYEYRKEILSEQNEIVNVCKKYMSSKDIENALKNKDKYH
jgi:hypothetical protein